MRINKYLALATGLSRRAADKAISENRVTVNGKPATPGAEINERDLVKIDGKTAEPQKSLTILLNKPVGYVCSRNGQGSKTIYEILPQQYHSLKPVGRLDKDSSGLLLLTNDGLLANKLTHPKFEKQKRYVICLNKPLAPLHHQMINDLGIDLPDGRSQLMLESIGETKKYWIVNMSEGRNRQIRRTFAALGYTVKKLHRTHFGSYTLTSNIKTGNFSEVEML